MTTSTTEDHLKTKMSIFAGNDMLQVVVKVKIDTIKILKLSATDIVVSLRFHLFFKKKVLKAGTFLSVWTTRSKLLIPVVQRVDSARMA